MLPAAYESNEHSQNQLQNEDQSIYPFTRRQLAQQLRRKKFPYHQGVVSMNQIPNEIKHRLKLMELHGYDFWYSSSWDLLRQFMKVKKEKKGGKKYKIYKFRRNCYMRMECQNCKNPKKKTKNRRWTTSLGTFQIHFILVDMKDLIQCESYGKDKSQPQKYQKVLFFKHKVYRMKCKQCMNWGTIYMYRALMKVMTHYFCRILAEILQETPSRNFHERPLKKIEEPSLKNHISELCEACEQGVCPISRYQFYKGQLEVNSEDEFDEI